MSNGWCLSLSAAGCVCLLRNGKEIRGANKDCFESNQSNRYFCFEKGGDTAVTREPVVFYFCSIT